MNVLDVVYGLLFEPSGVGKTVVIVVLATLLIGTFITGIIITLCGYGFKYRSSARTVIKSIYSSADTYDIRMQIGNLPSPVLGAWHQFQKSKAGRPSDYMTSQVCVDDPMKMAWLKVLSKLMYLMSTASIVFFVGYDIGQMTFRTGVVLFLGGLFLGIMLNVIDKINYDLTLQTHKKLAMAMDTFAHTSTVFEQPVYMEKPRYVGQTYQSYEPYVKPQQSVVPTRAAATPCLTPRGFKSILDPLGLGTVFAEKKEEQQTIKFEAPERKVEKAKEPVLVASTARAKTQTRREPPIIWNAY